MVLKSTWACGKHEEGTIFYPHEGKQIVWYLFKKAFQVGNPGLQRDNKGH